MIIAITAMPDIVFISRIKFPYLFIKYITDFGLEVYTYILGMVNWENFNTSSKITLFRLLFIYVIK